MLFCYVKRCHLHAVTSNVKLCLLQEAVEVQYVQLNMLWCVGSPSITTTTWICYWIMLWTTHWPRVCGLAASADVWLSAIETEISAPYGPLWLGKGFSFNSVCYEWHTLQLHRHHHHHHVSMPGWAVDVVIPSQSSVLRRAEGTQTASKLMYLLQPEAQPNQDNIKRIYGHRYKTAWIILCNKQLPT